jgi:hypothetical protein
MRVKISALLVAALLLAPFAAYASTISYGPITFGSNTPLVSAGFNPQYSLLQTSAPGISLGFPFLVPSDDSFTQTIAFYFDLAPGWAITGLTFNDFTDYGTNQQSFQNWGYKYAQQITLCPSSGACSSASTGGYLGGYPLPPISLNAQAGPNVGLYQAAGYAHNVQVGTKPGGSNVNIFLAQTAIAPEPRTLLLFGTGILGLSGVIRHKVRKP